MHAILCSDDPHLQRHFIALPEDFHEWFAVNHFIPSADDVVCWAGDVPSGKVICTLQLNRKMIDHANYIFAYSLVLYAEIPESSGLDLAHLFSPIVTVAHYKGDSADLCAPPWTNIPPQTIFDFHQPRSAVAELFFRLASTTGNSGLTPCDVLRANMLNWASAVRWGPPKNKFPVYDYTELPAVSKSTQSYAVPQYRASKSLKTALKNVQRQSGSDEVVIIEVSSDDE